MHVGIKSVHLPEGVWLLRLQPDGSSGSVVCLAVMSTPNRIVVLITLSAFTGLIGCGGGAPQTTVTPPPPPPAVVVPTSLSGNYVVSFSGMELNAKAGTSTAFALLGTLTADGKGNLTGVIDLNDLDLTSTVGAASNVQTGLAVTGTYTVGADGRGTGSINFTVNGTKEQIGLDFVLISTAHGLITRFDNSGSGSGTLDLQGSASQSSFPSLAFSLSGSDANGFPLASGGAIAIASTFNVTGIQDFNENGSSTGASGLTLADTSTLFLTSNTGGKAEFDSTFGMLSFDVWVIDSTHVKLIETDSSGTVLSGDAFTQQTSFPVGQLVFTLGGFDASYSPFAAGGLMTSDAKGDLSGFEDFNDSGNFVTAPNVNASCTTFVAGRCDMAFTGFSNGAQNSFEFAAYPTSGGVLLLEIDSFGLSQGAAYLQSATTFAAAQYGLNLSGDNGIEVDDIAEFTAGSVSASPNITPGMLDENDLGGTLAPATLSGTYTPAALVPGQGSIAIKSVKTANGTLNLEYYIIDSTTIAFIETDPAQVGVGSFELQNAAGAVPLAQTHISMVRPFIQPRRSNNNCSGSPAFGTCPAPTAPSQVWCGSNNLASPCLAASPVGFTTTAPAAGSWSNQFEGLDAATIYSTKAGKLGEEPDPNGAVGPTDANGVGQYLEFADNFVQAFDRSTGNGIFSTAGAVAPQPIQNLFAQSATNDCQYPSLDGIASYDRIDNSFVLATVSDYVDTNKVSNYYLCIAVSAANGSVPASNLAGAGGQTLWNAYAYSLNAAIPVNANEVQFFPDYIRFGTWADGFYVSWDLEDVSNSYTIVGFEVCQLDRADMVAGLSTTPPQCYTYIPNYVVGAGTDKSLIHTVLPADFEGDNPIPGDTSGEYFLALVNPRNLGTNIQCSASPCTSNQLAFWTWSGLSNGAAPAFLTLTGHAFTPGCYNPKSPYVTTCVPQPFGTVTNGLDSGAIDGLGDRLMYRLAYRYITGTTNAEYLAVTHTVQEDATSQRTGIRYYQILAGSHPQTVLVGDIQDTTNFYFLSMPSAAMDKNGDLGITYTVTGSTVQPYGSLSNYDPSPFFVTVGSDGTLGTPVAILSNSGSSGQDETDSDWGEYVSVTADPNDDLTFWSVNEYMNGDQVLIKGLNECSLKMGNGSGCTWASRIFTCKKGSGC